MALSREEIIDYASRYVAAEAITDFPHDGDFFCLLCRELPEGKVLAEEEGWVFQGYGICSGYLLDDEAKPPGKWLWMHFLSLAVFPPAPQVFKLQPPHVVKGRFQDPARTREFRLVKMNFNKTDGKRQEKVSQGGKEGNVVPFRKKKQ